MPPPRTKAPQEPLNTDGAAAYSPAQLRDMNAAFSNAMLGAIAAGLEHAVTIVSTAPGTVRPVIVG